MKAGIARPGYESEGMPNDPNINVRPGDLPPETERTASRLLPWQAFEKCLLVAVLLDLALGGNGYLTQIDGFRLREILYVVCLAWVALRLTLVAPIRLDSRIGWLTVVFVLITALDASIGYLGGNELVAILAELKPLSYFPMLLFFAVAINKPADVSLVAGILASCGAIVAVLYVATLAGAALGLLDYVSVFEFLHQSDEFIFRHNPGGPFVGFLYKGAFYIGIAAIFLLFDPFRKTKYLAAIAIVALAMTVTRGLCLALLVSIVFGIGLAQNRKRWPLLVAQAALLTAVIFAAQRAEIALLVASGDLYIETGEKLTPEEIRKRYSLASARPGDGQRLEDIKFVIDNTTFSSALFGRGLGAPIGNRTRIEQTYIEVFYKQGILGLSIWLVIFAYSFLLYLRLPSESKGFGAAFLLSSLFVAVATATNTFLTGSIGMAVVLISAVSLSVLSRDRDSTVSVSDWYGVRPAPS